MRIGVFTDSYLPYTSGVVRSIETFKEELTGLGHEVYIFAPEYRNFSDEKNVFRFISIPSPTNRDFSLALPFSLRLRTTIKKMNLDIIHVHSPFLLGRLGARYSRRLGVPLVFTFHTLYDQYIHYVPFARSFTRELAQRISKDFCNQCHLVLVPTNVIGEYLRDIGVRAQVKCLPTGIKIYDYSCGDRIRIRERYGIPQNDLVLLFVGRLGQEKNVGFLLECFSIVNGRFPGTWLVLVGSGPEEDNLKKKARELGVGKRTVFTGTLPPTEVVHCYAGSDLFVFSSMTETQGLVIAEAKAAGLPTVAVNAFGVGEMVEDGWDGFLTVPDQEEFTGKIALLLENGELRREMGKRAKIRADEFSSTNCTKGLIGHYEELINLNKGEESKKTNKTSRT